MIGTCRPPKEEVRIILCPAAVKDFTYAEKHELATTDQFNGVDGDQSCQKVLGSVASSQKLGVVVVRQIDLLEQNRCLWEMSVLSLAFLLQRWRT